LLHTCSGTIDCDSEVYAIARFLKPACAWLLSGRKLRGHFVFSRALYVRSADGLIDFREWTEAKTGIMTKKVSGGPVM
jgi:hypothetical protein